MAIYTPTLEIPRPTYIPPQGHWRLAGFTDVTVLFGKNGSGKSVLLRTWRDIASQGTHYVTPERTGELNYQAQFIDQESTSEKRRQYSTRNFVNDYRSRIVARIHAYLKKRGEDRGKGKAPPAPPDELENYLSTLVPDLEFRLGGSDPSSLTLTRIEDGHVIKGVDELSSGEAQLVTLGIDILTMAAIWKIEEQPTRVMLIDEPDPHIHPDLQIRFADFLLCVKDAYELQVVVATHSTSLLAALGQLGGDSVSVVYMKRQALECTARAFGDVERELSACLGGHVLMGPLFGMPSLVVEGDDDYRVWSQVPRHHVTSFAVIPAHGADQVKRYQRSLEQIFASLRDQSTAPCGYALLDGDQTIPTDREQNHIQFLKLACREIENLYLSDEVLDALGTNFESAKMLIATRAGDHGDKENMLRQALNGDRRIADVKNVIREIATIIDPKRLDWTLRLGKVLGNNAPSGQLAEFLGSHVVDALWPKVPEPARTAVRAPAPTAGRAGHSPAEEVRVSAAHREMRTTVTPSVD